MKTSWKLCVAALAAALAAPAANATLITSLQGTVITFDEGGVALGAPNGPVQVGTGAGVFVNVSSQNGPLSVGEAPMGVWDLGTNGEWSLGKTFAGVDALADGFSVPALVFDFGAERWARVGAFLNFFPDQLTGFGTPEPLSIAAYDGDGNLLAEEYFVPVFTPADPVTGPAINQGAFYGIFLEEQSIAKFVVYGPAAAVDDLTLAPIPEPSTYALMLAGLAALGFAARRARRA